MIFDLRSSFLIIGAEFEIWPILAEFSENPRTLSKSTKILLKAITRTFSIICEKLFENISFLVCTDILKILSLENVIF